MSGVHYYFYKGILEMGTHSRLCVNNSDLQGELIPVIQPSSNERWKLMAECLIWLLIRMIWLLIRTIQRFFFLTFQKVLGGLKHQLLRNGSIKEFVLTSCSCPAPCSYSLEMPEFYDF